MKFKAIKRAPNTVGTEFALVRYTDGTFGVWKLCSNYAGHLRGGISQTWRYELENVSETAARDLYARRLKGKQK